MRIKKIMTLCAELAIVAGMTAGCAGKNVPAPEEPKAQTPQEWQEASEKIITALEDSEVRKSQVAADSAARILQGRREQFLFDRIAAAAKLEAERGEPGVYLLMVAALVGSEDSNVQAAMEAAYQAAGLDAQAIQNLSEAKKIENCSAALPGMTLYFTKDAQGRVVMSMDKDSKPYGPLVDDLKKNPTLCSSFGRDIATIYADKGGKPFKIYIADDPNYAAYMTPVPAPAN